MGWNKVQIQTQLMQQFQCSIVSARKMIGNGAYTYMYLQLYSTTVVNTEFGVMGTQAAHL